MLYFAYGSNLNHFQMKRRCKDSIFIKKFELKGYKLNWQITNMGIGLSNSGGTPYDWRGGPFTPIFTLIN